MKVVLRKQHYEDRIYDDLTLGGVYYVLGINDFEHFWIMNDKGRAFDYEICLFDVIDSSIPDDWEIYCLGDEFYCIYPKEFNDENDDFWDMYYEGNLKEREIASEKLNKYLEKLHDQKDA